LSTFKQDPYDAVRKELERFPQRFERTPTSKKTPGSDERWQLANWQIVPPGPSPFTMPESCGRPVTFESLATAVRNDPSLYTLGRALLRFQDS
jgi:hypothetical protein